MTVKLDRTAHSVVVTCTDCPSWRELRGDVLTAGAVASEHDRREHASYQASKAQTARKRRRLGLTS